MISATYPIHFVTATANETQQGTTVSSRGFFFRRWTSREQRARSFFPSAENIRGNRERARTILIPQSWPAPLQKVTTTRTEGRKGETGTLEGERKKEKVRVRPTNNWAKLLLANNYSND